MASQFPESDWLDRIALTSAKRLLDTDPALLSPVGRELREGAARDIVRKQTLRVIRPGKDATDGS